jgi:hypothetical protein
MTIPGLQADEAGLASLIPPAAARSSTATSNSVIFWFVNLVNGRA